MDLAALASLLKESLYLIIILMIFLVIAIKKGRQTVTNIILGLYLALLISKEFPFYDSILGASSSAGSESVLKIILFTVFAVIATILFARILPREYDEGPMEGLGRKFLLACAGTVLLVIFSYHVLPITEFIHPGSPINYLFGSTEVFFYWLLLPLAVLFIV